MRVVKKVGARTSSFFTDVMNVNNPIRLSSYISRWAPLTQALHRKGTSIHHTNRKPLKKTINCTHSSLTFRGSPLVLILQSNPKNFSSWILYGFLFGLTSSLLPAVSLCFDSRTFSCGLHRSLFLHTSWFSPLPDPFFFFFFFLPSSLPCFMRK